MCRLDFFANQFYLSLNVFVCYVLLWYYLIAGYFIVLYNMLLFGVLLIGVVWGNLVEKSNKVNTKHHQASTHYVTIHCIDCK